MSAQLQDLWTDGEIVVFQFYSRRELYLALRLHPSAPLLWLQDRKPRVKRAAKPVTVFVNSHGKNLYLRELHVLLDQGRVLEFLLSGGDKECRLRFDLIPKNPNLMAASDGKSISWNKPVELPPPQLPVFERIARDWEAWSRQAAEFHGTAATSSAAPVPAPLEKAAPAPPKSEAQKQVEKDLQKKRKAITAMTEQLQASDADRYRELGDHLKASEAVPEHLSGLYNAERSRFDNMAAAYQKAKDIERKRQGTQARITLLLGEVAKLEQRLASGRFDQKEPAPSRAGQVMKKAQAAGRRLQLEGGFEAALGKSGADNLAILRQARAWDLWVHLKGEPGAHAVLFRNRDQAVPRETVQAVAEWVWKESKGKKLALVGQKYEVIVVECRFVKPIKGDRLGRVTYHHPQVYTFASKSPSSD